MQRNTWSLLRKHTQTFTALASLSKDLPNLSDVGPIQFAYFYLTAVRCIALRIDPGGRNLKATRPNSKASNGDKKRQAQKKDKEILCNVVRAWIWIGLEIVVRTRMRTVQDRKHERMRGIGKNV